MLRKKKHNISLIEVLISLTLFSVLLGSLGLWYLHMNTKKSLLEKLRLPLMEERYVAQRLQNIIPRAQTPFVHHGNTLTFRFDRGLSAHPLLSDVVIGKLYLDEAHKTLCLGIWPNVEKDEEVRRSPFQTFTLLDRVDQIEFDFYSPPDPFKKPVDPEEIGKPRPKEGWQLGGGWSYGSLPALVNLKIKRDGRTEKLFFDLNQPIIYPTDGL